MATFTPNLNLRKPAPSDAVDVAADIGANMDAIDTAVNGKAASGHTHSGLISGTLVDAKGDLIVATAADTVTRLGVGTDGQVLTAASGQATGLEWATPSGGGGITGQGAGTNSVLVGDSASASADQAAAFGDFAVASSDGAIAIGSGTNATSAPQATTAQGAIAIGASNHAAANGARASAQGTVAIGSGAGSGDNGASASGLASVAIGGSDDTFDGAVCSGGNAVSIGTGSSVNQNNGIAIGFIASVSTAADGIAIGRSTSAAGADAIAIGRGAAASAGDGVAVGRGASCTHADSVAIGQQAATTAVNQIVLGTSSETVYIPGVLHAPVVANRQTSSYTLVLSDAGKVVEQNVGSANNLTVPPNSSVAFPTGTVIEVMQYGAGQTTIAPGSGVTIRSSGGKLKLAAQYAGASLRKIATDEWVAVGELSA